MSSLKLFWEHYCKTILFMIKIIIIVKRKSIFEAKYFNFKLSNRK